MEEEKTNLIKTIKSLYIEIQKLSKKKEKIENEPITKGIKNKINEYNNNIEEIKQKLEKEQIDNDLLKSEFQSLINIRIEKEQQLENDKKNKNDNFEGEKEGIAKMKDELINKEREKKEKEKEFNELEKKIKKLEKEKGEITKKINALEEKIKTKKNQN